VSRRGKGGRYVGLTTSPPSYDDFFFPGNSGSHSFLEPLIHVQPRTGSLYLPYITFISKYHSGMLKWPSGYDTGPPSDASSPNFPEPFINVIFLMLHVLKSTEFDSRSLRAIFLFPQPVNYLSTEVGLLTFPLLLTNRSLYWLLPKKTI
jgi:hypothetical protein